MKIFGNYFKRDRLDSRLRGNDSCLDSIRSFTLNELLITIAVIAVMSAAVVIILNPVEFLGQSRDAQRVSDVDTLNTAVGLYASNVRGFKGNANTVYISLPDTAANCPTHLASLPTLPSGWSYNCVTEVNLMNIDGSGWVPVNLNALPGGSTIQKLPTDPTNTAASGLYYAYIGDTNGYELVSLLESEKHLKTKAVGDGGMDPGRYESGSTVAYWKTASGLVGYWSFDGGVGSVANGQTAGFNDFSGGGHNGTASNSNGTGMALVTRNQGTAVIFDGIDDWISGITQPAIKTGPNIFTVSGAINPNNQAGSIITPQSVGMDQYISYDNGSQRIQVKVAESTDTNERSRYSTSGSVPVGNWTHWTASINDKNIKIYIDGILNAEYNETINIADWTSTWVIGQRGNSTIWMSGSLDDIHVFNRVLTAFEILSMYKSGR